MFLPIRSVVIYLSSRLRTFIPQLPRIVCSEHFIYETRSGVN